MSRNSFPKTSQRKTELLDLIYLDVNGQMETDSFENKKHFVEFTDEHSRCCETRFLKYKSKVLEATKTLSKWTKIKKEEG